VSDITKSPEPELTSMSSFVSAQDVTSSSASYNPDSSQSFSGSSAVSNQTFSGSSMMSAPTADTDSISPCVDTMQNNGGQQCNGGQQVNGASTGSISLGIDTVQDNGGQQCNGGQQVNGGQHPETDTGKLSSADANTDRVFSVIDVDDFPTSTQLHAAMLRWMPIALQHLDNGGQLSFKHTDTVGVVHTGSISRVGVVGTAGAAKTTGLQMMSGLDPN
jgi:hypothetical protein